MGSQKKDSPSPFVVSSPSAAAKIGLHDCENVFEKAASLGYRAQIVLSSSNETAMEKEERKPHDIKSAIRTMVLASEAITNGYRFDDDRASSKIRSISKAAKTLEEMSSFILSFYSKN